MNKKALVFIIFAGILWGTSGIFVNIWRSMELTSVQITSLRTLFSFPCFLVYALIFQKDALRSRLRDLPLFMGSGITLFTTAAFYYSSMQSTSIATAVILMYTAPVLVLAWSVAFFGEKLNLKKAVSVLCILIGCALVSGIAGGMQFNAFGVVMGLLSGVSYGLYNILTKIQMRKKCNPITATLYSFFFAAVLAVFSMDYQVVHNLFTESFVFAISLSIVHAVITFVMPYFLYTLSLKELPAGVASALGIIEPLSATVFSMLLFDEKLSAFSAAGIVLILGSVFVLAKTEE